MQGVGILFDLRKTYALGLPAAMLRLDSGRRKAGWRDEAGVPEPLGFRDLGFKGLGLRI